VRRRIAALALATSAIISIAGPAQAQNPAGGSPTDECEMAVPTAVTTGSRPHVQVHGQGSAKCDDGHVPDAIEVQVLEWRVLHVPLTGLKHGFWWPRADSGIVHNKYGKNPLGTSAVWDGCGAGVHKIDVRAYGFQGTARHDQAVYTHKVTMVHC
jgi:hypothetical protein